MPDELIRDLPLIKKYARRNDRDDMNFRLFLREKSGLSSPVIDAHARALTDEVWGQIDCLSCGNCCKTLQVVVDERDVLRLARTLQMTATAFRQKYLATDPTDGVRYFSTRPCPFLGEDNACSVYENRPQACRDYPFLEAKDFRNRSFTMIENTATCPIVFNVWLRLKSLTGYRKNDAEKTKKKK